MTRLVLCIGGRVMKHKMKEQECIGGDEQRGREYKHKTVHTVLSFLRQEQIHVIVVLTTREDNT